MFTPRTVESISGVVRLTNTPEQAVNLNPSLSDDGKVVVFESSANFFAGGVNDSFHAMRVEVRGDPPVFTDVARTRIVSPALSSDGSVVAFSSSEDLVGENFDRNSEIFLLTGSGLRQITHTSPPLTNSHASITADGTLVAFTSGGDLVVVDAKTEDFSLLANGAANPKISGDGSKLYYQHDSNLLLIDLKSKLKRIVVSEVPQLALASGRAVSHDGTRLVYSAEFVENQSQVFLFDARENTTRQLTHLGSRTVDVALQPTISGDGKRVAFATRRRVVGASDGGVELYVYDVPSGQTQQVTNAPSGATAEVAASLNLDGSLVAFSFPRVLSGPVTDGFENNNEIYLASLAGRPEFGVATVLNAASLRTAIAPGSIAIIRGNALGTSVKVSGIGARLIYVTPQEVGFVLPDSLEEGFVDVVVTNADGFVSKSETRITTSAPGVFTVNGNGEGEAIVLDADTQTVGPFGPSSGKLRLSIFATGVAHAKNVTAAINGQPLKVEAVARGGLPGLDEIHVLVPSELSGAGASTLTVTADGVQSNSSTITIGGSSLRDIVINEFLADPPDGLAGDANHDGVRDSADDEFVELVNSTARDLDLSGYELASRSLTTTNDTLRHRFASGTILPPGCAIVIFGGGSPDPHNPRFGSAQVVTASRGSLSLTNAGGVITLRKPTGEIVTSITYGAAVGLRADLNQSLTRAQDIIGQFVSHSTAAGAENRSFSPGTRIDGSVFSKIVHALFHRRNHFAARALWFRQLPRRPT
ncbi:MAG: lamin tail domain-containing protein [Pyrinomonadaceae bacterium]